jgi:adenosylcobinamide kinase / adenosylcobinamide-phosphate guanylyltransferase
MRTLVLGGIRSGKSQWAEIAMAEAVGTADPVRYIATGSTTDADPSWTQRVDDHRNRRPPHWSTDETDDVATLLLKHTGTATLVDDLGGWLTAVLDRREAWDGGSITEDIDELLSAVEAFGSPLVLVSPEVGLSVVPVTSSGRRFADELGALNRRVADISDSVVLIVAGQPLTVKDTNDRR